MDVETLLVGIAGWAVAMGIALGLGAAARRGDDRRAAAFARALTGR
jgi:hypothetical protein